MLHKAKTARLVITLYRHITDKLPTSYRHTTNCRPTDSLCFGENLSADRFFGELFFTITHLEELSIKLRNWNLFWFATFPNKQIARCKKGINSHPSTNRFPLSTLHFKTTYSSFRGAQIFFITISEHKLTSSLPCDGISFAISHSSWLANTR